MKDTVTRAHAASRSHDATEGDTPTMYSYSEETVKHLAQIAAMEAEARAELAQIDLAAAATDYPTAITVPDPMDLPIPTPMLVTAWRLASAFGHRWAREISQLGETGAGYVESDGSLQPVVAEWILGVGPNISPWTARQIALSCAIHEAEQVHMTGHGWVGGIMAPAVRWDADVLGEDDTPVGLVIEHVTITGRSRWTVYDDGSCNLSVSRPDPSGAVDAWGQKASIDVLHVCVYADGTISRWTPMSELPYYRRHVVAMGRMLECLMEGTDAWLVAASLMDRARRDQRHLRPT